jgi:hypothetical protein
MGPAADIALGVGVISALNEVVFAPAAGGTVSFNWRIVPATAVFALLVNGLADINPQLALGIAVSALATVLLVPTGKAGSPVANLDKALGYKTS